MSGLNKGQVTQLDLMAVAIVFFVGIGLFLLADFLVTQDIIVSRQTIQLSMDIDDRGSELVSLLGATSGGMPNMEIAGDVLALGYETNISENLAGLEMTAQLLGSGYTFLLPGSSATQSECIREDTGSFPGTLEWPMPDVFSVSSNPGFRQLEGQSCSCHAGVDIPGDGMGVVAAYDGVVSFAGWNDGGYGNMVILAHEGGYETRYGHLDSITLTAGQMTGEEEVMKGQQIGLSGDTGKSTGPHLHFEIRKDGLPIDPCLYMVSAPPECYVDNRCIVGEETEYEETYSAQVPVPGARAGNLKKEVRLVT